MLKDIKKNFYKKSNGAKEDAKAILEVLGNEELVQKVIADRGISKGKWEFIFDEIYEQTVDKKDSMVLKHHYLDIVKRGDVEVLWTGFAHHQEKREKAEERKKEKKKEDFIASMVFEAFNNGMDLEELKNRIQSYTLEEVMQPSEDISLEKEEQEQEPMEPEEEITVEKPNSDNSLQPQMEQEKEEYVPVVYAADESLFSQEPPEEEHRYNQTEEAVM